MRKLILITLLLSGCAAINQNKMQNSQQAYIGCLKTNPTAPKNCEIDRIQYEADKSTFEHTGGGLFGGKGDSPNMNQTINNSPQPRMWMENRNGQSYQCNDIGGTVNCN